MPHYFDVTIHHHSIKLEEASMPKGTKIWALYTYSSFPSAWYPSISSSLEFLYSWNLFMCHFTYLLDVYLLQLWYSSHKDRLTFLATVPNIMFPSIKIMNEKN